VDASRTAGEKHFPLSAAEKKTLLKLARDTLNASVRKGAFDEAPLRAVPETASLQRRAGAFVTLKCKLGAGAVCAGKGDGLRGCIGTIAPITPVSRTVAQRASSAALEDSRFPTKVSEKELKLIHVEVSVLTPPRRVASHKEIVIGRHGIILRKDGRSATFLPQVAPEQGWNRDQTLSYLSRKAGLGVDGWKSGASFMVYEAIVFSEGE
jgi:AmmeMemoRadiSam system protein A